MVTQWILEWFSAGIAWLGGILTLPSPPSFVTDLPGYVATASSYLVGTGAWIPWTVVIAVLTVYVTCLVAGLAAKLARIVASFLTLGGGSAA